LSNHLTNQKACDIIQTLQRNNTKLMEETT
jgi:hypothetical protein